MLKKCGNIYYAHRGLPDSELSAAEKELSFTFPEDFKKLYAQTDGLGVDLGYTYFEMWGMDSILSAHGVLSEDYVFFADDEIDFYAYEKSTGKIFAFSGDDAVKCADDLMAFSKYLKEL